MTRKKVTLAYITNDGERKASFKKRKKGLIKKVNELTTLCGVEACAIIYSPYEPEPEIWPSQLGAMAVVARFRNLSEMDRSRKMVNQESFTRQRIKKLEDQLRRTQKENKRKEMESFMFQALAGVVGVEQFDLRDAAEMGWVINQTLREITSRMEAMKINGGQAAAAVVAPPPPAPAEEETRESFMWMLMENPRGGGWEMPAYPNIFNNSNKDEPAGSSTGHGGAN